MKYPIGIQNFEDLIQTGCVYIDKTNSIYKSVDVEWHTTDGRMDILMQTSDNIYILELKIDQNAGIALRQIEEKGYARPFAADTRKLFKIGVNFSTETRRIDDWKVK